MAGQKVKGPVKAQSAPELPRKGDQLVEDNSSLLKVAQGPLLSNLAYTRAVEAVVSAAKKGIAKELASEWRDAAVRLLQSRSNSPLALLWAYVAIQRCNFEGGLESGNLNGLGSQVSVIESLLHSLNFMTAGFCGGPTAIAAAAPIVQLLIHSLATFSRTEKDTDLSKKKKEKLRKTLQRVIFEVSGFIALCHHKDAPVMDGVFKAPSVNIGLDVWLSQDSDFSSLFPFATQLRVDGFLNSIESVLFLGEVVETEVALLRLVVEILDERFALKPSNKHELEKKLKHIIIVHASLLGSSRILLDMLLDAPLELGGILDEDEELLLRNVLGEMAVVGVPNSGIFDEDRSDLSAGINNTVGKDSVAFLKRILIARQLAADFRSRGEHLRASDLLTGLRTRGAPLQFGQWLGDRSSLRLLISTAVLQKPQALLEWLLNARNDDFNVVLDKAYIDRPKNKILEDVGMDFDQNPDEALFFIDTSRVSDKDAADSGFDADQAYVMAAGQMQVESKGDVLFHKVDRLERKRARNAANAKQSKRRNGEKVKELEGGSIGEDTDKSMSENDSDEDESEEESSMSE